LNQNVYNYCIIWIKLFTRLSLTFISILFNYNVCVRERERGETNWYNMKVRRDIDIHFHKDFDLRHSHKEIIHKKNWNLIFPWNLKFSSCQSLSLSLSLSLTLLLQFHLLYDVSVYILPVFKCQYWSNQQLKRNQVHV